MTHKDYQFADHVLKHLLSNHHYGTDKYIEPLHDGGYQRYYDRQMVYRFLLRIGLAVQEPDAIEYVWDNELDDSVEEKITALSLTPDGIEAAEVGVRQFLQLRKDRENAHYQANLATSRGYNIHRWGIAFTVLGLVMSGANLYLFSKQVSWQASQEQTDVQRGGNDGQSIGNDRGVPNDSLASGPSLTSGHEPLE